MKGNDRGKGGRYSEKEKKRNTRACSAAAATTTDAKGFHVEVVREHDDVKVKNFAGKPVEIIEIRTEVGTYDDKKKKKLSRR